MYAATPTGTYQTIVPTPVRTYSLSGTVNLSSPFHGEPTSAQAARRFQLTARFEF